jgi:hypothetical protein
MKLRRFSRTTPRVAWWIQEPRSEPTSGRRGVGIIEDGDEEGSERMKVCDGPKGESGLLHEPNDDERIANRG